MYLTLESLFRSSFFTNMGKFLFPRRISRINGLAIEWALTQVWIDIGPEVTLWTLNTMAVAHGLISPQPSLKHSSGQLTTNPIGLFVVRMDSDPRDTTRETINRWLPQQSSGWYLLSKSQNFQSSRACPPFFATNTPLQGLHFPSF